VIDASIDQIELSQQSHNQ